MATKLTDSCLQKAADDEPIFVLRAQDLSAPGVVEHWANHAAGLLGFAHPKVIEARLLAHQMRSWQSDPARGAKWPD